MITMSSVSELGGLSTKTEKNVYGSEELAAAYVKGRSAYPDEAINSILEFYHKNSKDFSPINLALDVGCGSGQFTQTLAQHCRQVIASDISHAQIQEALKLKANDNIQYRVGDCYDLSVESGSVDLITAGTAMHRFDNIPGFMSEVERCLKPGGVLACFCYMVSPEYTNHAVTDICRKFVITERGLKLYWTKSANIALFDRYKSIKLPFSDSQRFDYRKLVPKTLATLRSLVKSLESYQNLHEVDPEKAIQVLDDMISEISAVLGRDGEPEEHVSFEIEFDCFGVMCRKPLS